jgi:hypothetical protein
VAHETPEAGARSSRASRERGSGHLRGCSEPDAARPARELLGRIPWEQRRPDPERMTAEQFLGSIVG